MNPCRGGREGRDGGGAEVGRVEGQGKCGMGGRGALRLHFSIWMRVRRYYTWNGAHTLECYGSRNIDQTHTCTPAST